ncbi:hypothetical protein [Mucilaginibacter sp.]|uniref:hypothetical protein n=1 Tax=Mucilaginibacter sp. TaxID=1882438 RepID=UPI003266FB28
MKNKGFLITAFVIALLLVSICWELCLFIMSPDHRLAELPKQLMLGAALLWIVTVLFSQNQDDDDWAGQY